MLLPPNVSYPSLPAPKQAQQPLNENELTDADANFEFSSHQRPFRTNASKAEKARQEQEEHAQVKEQDSSNATPKLTRCEQCKKDKKGCDLGETGYPCTRCKTRKVLCVGCDTPIPLRLLPKKTKRTPKPHFGMSTQPVTGNDMATTPISATAPDIQGVETVESRLFGRDEAPPRARSAGPQREALFSDKCDNTANGTDDAAKILDLAPSVWSIILSAMERIWTTHIDLPMTTPMDLGTDGQPLDQTLVSMTEGGKGDMNNPNNSGTM
jgi:hypothetical protein